MIYQKVALLLICFFVVMGTFSDVTSTIGKSTQHNSILIEVDPVLSYFGDDWPDGVFYGTWGADDDTPLGSVSGYLNQGRRSTLGWFAGEWKRTSDNMSGSFQGRFRGRLVFGRFHEGSESFLFFGILDADDTHFTIRLYTIGVGVLCVSGTHMESFLPALTGEYGVGARLFHFIDESRLEEFTPDDPDDFREMMVQVWYPINHTSAGQRIEYMDDPTFQWLKGRSPVPLVTIPDHAYLFVRPYTKQNITMADDETHYPVIIFSHGYDGVYQIYTSLIENLVSHGFVVASINHPYIAGITVFPDGRTVGLASGYPGDLGLRSVVEDAKFVLTMMEELNQTDTMFQGRFDLSTVGMYGHSFGGAATAICCYEDDRFDAGLTLDGVNPINYTSEGVEKPFCLMLAEARFEGDQSVDDMWELLLGDAYKVGIIGSTHYGFTDVGILLKHLTPLIPPNILGFGTIAPKRMVNITRSFELAFFNVYLEGESTDVLFDLADEFDEVLLEYK